MTVFQLTSCLCVSAFCVRPREATRPTTPALHGALSPRSPAQTGVRHPAGTAPWKGLVAFGAEVAASGPAVAADEHPLAHPTTP